MWLDGLMTSMTLFGLSEDDTAQLILGSSFARRIRASDPEHGSRLCDHGRLHFQRCPFCDAGHPAVCNPTVEEMRANAREFLI